MADATIRIATQNTQPVFPPNRPVIINTPVNATVQLSVDIDGNTVASFTTGGGAPVEQVNGFSVTAGAGLLGGTITSSGTISLPAVNSTVGDFTNANISVDQFGRITAASSGTVQQSGNAGTVTSITAGSGLTGGVITGSGTIALPTVNNTPGSYDFASITVDQYGRVTAANSNTIAGSAGVTAITAGSGLTGGTITATGTIGLAAVISPGTFNYATITVDEFGRTTSAHSNAAPSGGGGSGTELPFRAISASELAFSGQTPAVADLPYYVDIGTQGAFVADAGFTAYNDGDSIYLLMSNGSDTADATIDLGAGTRPLVGIVLIDPSEISPGDWCKITYQAGTDNFGFSLVDQPFIAGTATGDGDGIVFSPGKFPNYRSGIGFTIIPAGTNTGPATLTIDGAEAVGINNLSNPGDIQAGVAYLFYDADGTGFTGGKLPQIFYVPGDLAIVSGGNAQRQFASGITFGDNNIVQTPNSLVFGANNVLRMGQNLWVNAADSFIGTNQPTTISIIIGEALTVDGSTSLVIGGSITSLGTNILALGATLNIIGDFITVIGNNDTVTSGSNDIFVLGDNLTANGSYLLLLGSSYHAIGSANHLIANGSGHSLDGANFSLVIGTNHTSGSFGNAIFGQTHTVDGTLNLISGNNNNVAGSNNIVGGGNHTISGPSNLIGGGGHTVAADNTLVVGVSNQIDGTASYSVVFGHNNLVHSDLGNNQILVWGSGNTGAAQSSIIFGNNSSNSDTATGSVLFGDGGLISGSKSFGFGDSLDDHGNTGGFYHTGVMLDGLRGSAQSEQFILSGKQVDATPIVLTSDGNAPSAVNIAALADNSAALFDITVVAINTTSKAAGIWTLRNGLIVRGTGAASTVIPGGSPAFVAGASSAVLTGVTGPSVAADTSNGGFAIGFNRGSSPADWNVVATLTLTKVMCA